MSNSFLNGIDKPVERPGVAPRPIQIRRHGPLSASQPRLRIAALRAGRSRRPYATAKRFRQQASEPTSLLARDGIGWFLNTAIVPRRNLTPGDRRGVERT